ncbi:S41 family peptidase [Nonomuraea sp. NPDC023979]|uniref:S41 family peptidase n=1 Tax=Nonomuraea sp. NPDC023979 TaxID=3154796 RepID=UPI0033E1911A
MIRTLCAAALAAACALSPAPVPSPSSPSEPGGRCAPATAPPPQPPPPTTVNTLRMAYHCVLDHYYSGPAMDPRELLKSAFSAYTQDLMRRGADRPGLHLPALTGDRDGDWAAFAKVLGDGDPAALRAAITGMVDSLQDNHARTARPSPPPDGGPGDGPVGTGIAGLSAAQGPRFDPAARPPLFITRVLDDSPADRAGIRPGDIVLKVNGIPVFVGDRPNTTVFDVLPGPSVRLTLKRPTSGQVRTVRLVEGPLDPPRDEVTSRKLPGGAVYVKLPGFFPGAADQVLAELRDKPEAVVLDLRGNGGGSPREVTRLLGAFAHGKVTSYFCPLKGECAANRTDDSVPLLGARLVVLADRGCASACDDFSAAVKGLRLGTIVGTRTAGAVSGPAAGYLLDDGTVLGLPKVRHLGPNRETIDTIGTPADHHAPMTALALATGRDPGLAKALDLLR